MEPPTCPLTGKHLRILALLGVLGYFIYFLVDGLQEPPSARAVFICDTGDSEMIECVSFDDVTTCAGLMDGEGNEAKCIQSSCGYRLFPHIDISIAGTPDPYDADAATDPTTFLSVMSIIYSIVPYLLAFVYLVLFLATGNLVPLTRLCVLGIIAILNDLVLKKILTQRRPAGSCLYFLSFGLPSGHSATSIGLLAYLLLETFVYHPNLICGLTCQRGEGKGAYVFRRGYGWRRESEDSVRSQDEAEPSGVAGDSIAIDIHGSEGDKDDDRPKALSKRSCTQKWLKHLCAIGYFLLLFPVPFSRVYLHDHIRTQVLYGALVGLGAATPWYLAVVRWCGMRIIEWRKSRWGKWWGLRLGWEEGIC